MAALVLGLTGTAESAEGDPSIWSFSGFGTLAAVHSSEHEADFVGRNQQPNGAGRTQATSFNPDSKLGGQVTARFNPELSAVVQVVSQQLHDNSWAPRIEWANVQYQFSPALRVRVGRIAMPTFMVSETRQVGYANPSVRPPQEVYLINTITSNDGVDATHVSHFGDAVNSLSGFYGTSTARLPGDVTVKAKSSWGINDTLEMGATALRVSYASLKADVESSTLQPLSDGLNGFGAAASAIPVASIQAAGAQAYALAQRYGLKDLSRQTLAIGVSHDTGYWFVTGEYVRFIGSGPFANANAGYVSAGYRIDSWTPYATLAAIRTPQLAVGSISTAGLPAQLAVGAAGLNAGLSALAGDLPAPTQKSVTLGLRWDFMKNAAAKLQYDHIDLGANSYGQLVNRSSSYQPGGKLNLVSAAVDFVF
ncbi:MAG: hypothetical protein ABI574_09510 [Burkholderiales bacterium]